MTGVLIQRGNMDTETDMHAGGPPGEHEGRDGAMGQGAVELASSLPEASGEAWGGSARTALRGDQLCPHLHPGLAAQKPYISAAFTSRVGHL